MSDPTRGSSIEDSGFCPECGNKIPCLTHQVEGSKETEGLQENLNIKGTGALIGVEISGLPESFESDGREWRKKSEFHVTMVGFATKLDKLCKEKFGLSNKDAKTKAGEILQKATEGISFKVNLKDEFRTAERGEDRTIIQLCDIEGMEEYFQAIEAELETTIERPPAHVTLYTGENDQAIGLPTQAKFDELTKPLEGSELDEVISGMGK